MLIDCSYFTNGSRQIQNATLEGTPTPESIAVREYVEAYIAGHQEGFLRRMLGSSAGSRANAYLVCLDEDEDPKRNESYDAVCNRLKESFADYVYFHIIGECSQQATMTGFVRLKCANEHIAPIVRQVKTWNSMVEKNRLFAEWIHTSGCPLKGLEVASEMLTNINRFNL